jgi:hypothetical protein
MTISMTKNDAAEVAKEKTLLTFKPVSSILLNTSSIAVALVPVPVTTNTFDTHSHSK